MQNLLLNNFTIKERLQFDKNGNVDNYSDDFQKFINAKGIIKEKEIFDLYNYDEKDFKNIFRNLNEDEIKERIDTLNNMQWYKDFKKSLRHFESFDITEYINNNSLDISICTLPFTLYFCKLIATEIKNLKNITISNEAINDIVHKISTSLTPLIIKTLIYDINLNNTSDDYKLEVYLKDKFLNVNSLLEFYHKYPVLIRRVSTKARFITNHFIELIRRFDKNHLEITKKLDIESNQNKINRFHCNEGDTHQQGRFVVRIELDNEIIIYKPRNLIIQKEFDKFISFINKTSGLLDLKVNNAYYGDEFTFENFVKNVTCKKNKQIENYYERFGQILALIYLLKGNDIHYENIIANEEYPVIIDIETLFQSNLSHIYLGDGAQVKAIEKIFDSINITGMLPMKSFKDEVNPEGYDISGLNGIYKNVDIMYERLIDTDNVNIRIGKVMANLESANNIPILNGEKVGYKNHIKFIIVGFEKMLNYFNNNKNLIIGKDGILNIFKGIKNRQLLKSTQHYANIMKFSSHPNYSKDIVYLERMLMNIYNSTYKYKDIILYEIEDMLNDDIPIFFGEIGTKNLITSTGISIENFFDFNFFDFVTNKIKNLSQKEIYKYVSDIKLSLENIDYEVNEILYNNKSNNLEKKVITNHDLTNFNSIKNEIIDILDLLKNEAIICDKTKTITWNQLTYDSKNSAWKIAPMNNNLTDGKLGILLFLNYTDKVLKTNNKNTIEMILEDIKTHKLDEFNGDVYYNIVSKLYSLYIFIKENNRVDLLEYFNSDVDYLIKNNNIIDNLNISQKTLLIKLLIDFNDNYYREDINNLITDLGDKIKANYKNLNKQYTSNSFIEKYCYELLALYYINCKVNNTEYNNLINDFIEITDSILSNRTLYEFVDTSTLLLIIKCRSNMINADDQSFYELSEKLLKSINRNVDSLVNGSLFLLELSIALNNDKISNDIIRKILQNKHLTNKFTIKTISGYENLSLMDGLIGIGYELLRFLENEAVPNILI